MCPIASPIYRGRLYAKSLIAVSPFDIALGKVSVKNIVMLAIAFFITLGMVT